MELTQTPDYTEITRASTTPVMFKRVESITHVKIPPEQQTDKMAEVFRRLLDYDQRTELYSSERLNREFAEEVMTSREKAARGENVKPCTVVFCDLNHFKDYNTAFGQERTDKLIEAIAKELKGIIRAPKRPPPANPHPGKELRKPPSEDNDIIARKYSTGDEFLILMPGCDRETAETRMEGFAKKLADKRFLMKDREGKNHEITNVTLSFGCKQVEFPPAFAAAHGVNPNGVYPDAYKRLEPVMNETAEWIDQAEKVMAEYKKRMKSGPNPTSRPIITAKSYPFKMDGLIEVMIERTKSFFTALN